MVPVVLFAPAGPRAGVIRWAVWVGTLVPAAPWRRLWFWTVHPAACHVPRSHGTAGRLWGGGSLGLAFWVDVPSMRPLLVMVVPAVALLRMWAEFSRVIDDRDELTL